MTNDRIANLEAKLEARSLQRDNDLAGLREDYATLAESLRSAQSGNGELARRLGILESIPRASVISYWGPALATASVLGAALGWALNERVTPIKEMAISAAEDSRELSAIYGALAREQAASQVIQQRNTEWLRGLENRTGENTKRLERLDERSRK
jgi:hypothetical protein